jgi:hypothetical protein
MPRGAAEIGLPLRHRKGATNNRLQGSYTTELTVAGVVRLLNNFSSYLSLWPLQEGHEEF